MAVTGSPLITSNTDCANRQADLMFKMFNFLLT